MSEYAEQYERGFDAGKDALRDEIEAAWKVNQMVKPDESQTEYDLRRAFEALRILQGVIE